MATLAPAPGALPPAAVWTGRALSGLFALFMLGASIAPKLLGMPVAAETIVALGWSPDFVLMIGLFELAFTVLYLVPQTSVLGAVLMTALLGGAMATHIRVGSPLFSHVLFGAYVGLALWAGLLARRSDARAQLFGSVGG